MPQIAILILAAGASSRMGGKDKLMLDAGGLPLLARVTTQAKATGLPVFVTIPDLSHPRTALSCFENVTLIAVPDRASGMSASIRVGLSALPQTTTGVMILPADMPDLQTQDLHAIAQAALANPGAIIRATTVDAIPGHPVIFPADLFEALGKLVGDQGARSVIAANKSRLIPQILPGNRALTDLDTPADWEAWRSGQDVDKKQ